MVARTASRNAWVVGALFIALAFGLNLWRTETQQQRQSAVLISVQANQRDIAANAARIEVLVRAECETRNVGTTEMNRTLDALIEGTLNWDNPRAQASRLRLWRATKLPITPCR